LINANQLRWFYTRTAILMKKGSKKNIKRTIHKSPHLPFEELPFALSMGLLKTPNSHWFEIFDLEERALQFAAKRKFLASMFTDVFMADSSALTASMDILNLMIENLTTYQSDLYFLKKNSIKIKPHKNFKGEELLIDPKRSEMHPLDLAARLVQEDLLIMLPPNKQHKEWWLAAGSLAFPSRWSLKNKFRKTMDAIHAPVPFYKDELKVPTNNFFDQMPCDSIFARRNWSLHDSPSLRQTEAQSIIKNTDINAKNAGERLWLRVERQTLRKLKVTDAILFTIRVHIRPLKEIAEFDGVAKRLNKVLSDLPPEMQLYKQTNIFCDSVQEYLDQF
jgi:dimethylamine monooxygenase subunit A